MIYFASDWHHFHENIIKFYPDKRKFSSCEEMWEDCIRYINTNVGIKDSIIYLGDLIWYKAHRNFAYSKWEELKNRLNCKKIIWIRGNHDRNFEDNIQWKDYYEFKLDRNFFVCSHYPIFSWNKCHRGSYLLCGHSHSGCNSWHEDKRSMDVGYDSIGKWAISIDEVLAIKSGKGHTAHH